ncbi:SPASM domain-containing protein [bacterium]|nr:SPASM domain-containing protein [bacterium]
MYICSQPFENLEIKFNGDLHFCCERHLPISIGNIYKNSFDEIWNSEVAKKIRKCIVKSNYSLCHEELCTTLQSKAKNIQDISFLKDDGTILKGPKYVTFCHDRECNIACVYCRKELLKNSDEEIAFLNEKIETDFLPLLKDTEIVVTNAHGDAFGSRHSRYLIKRIHEIYPNIKFEIFTNGILFNKYNIDNLKIENNLNVVKISLPATTKETYKKMVLNGDLYFDKLIDNLEYVSELKKTKNFDFYMFFIVTSLNYKEIIPFLDLAKKLGAFPVINEYLDVQNRHDNKHPEYVITDKNHSEYNEFVKIIQDQNILYNRPKVGMSPGIRKIFENKDS